MTEDEQEGGPVSGVGSGFHLESTDPATGVSGHFFFNGAKVFFESRRTAEGVVGTARTESAVLAEWLSTGATVTGHVGTVEFAATDSGTIAAAAAAPEAATVTALGDSVAPLLATDTYDSVYDELENLAVLASLLTAPNEQALTLQGCTGVLEVKLEAGCNKKWRLRDAAQRRCGSQNVRVVEWVDWWPYCCCKKADRLRFRCCS